MGDGEKGVTLRNRCGACIAPEIIALRVEAQGFGGVRLKEELVSGKTCAVDQAHSRVPKAEIDQAIKSTNGWEVFRRFGKIWSIYIAGDPCVLRFEDAIEDVEKKLEDAAYMLFP